MSVHSPHQQLGPVGTDEALVDDRLVFLNKPISGSVSCGEPGQGSLPSLCTLALVPQLCYFASTHVL